MSFFVCDQKSACFSLCCCLSIIATVKKLLAIGAWIATFFYPYALLTADFGTCTQHDDSSYFASIFFTIVLLIVFLLFWIPSRAEFKKMWKLSSFHIITIFVYFGMSMPKYLWFGSFKGYELCSLRSDNQFIEGVSIKASEAGTMEPYSFGIIHTIIFLLIVFFTLKQWKMWLYEKFAHHSS